VHVLGLMRTGAEQQLCVRCCGSSHRDVYTSILAHAIMVVKVTITHICIQCMNVLSLAKKFLLSFTLCPDTTSRQPHNFD
jgi:hypothetical protein